MDGSGTTAIEPPKLNDGPAPDPVSVKDQVAAVSAKPVMDAMPAPSTFRKWGDCSTTRIDVAVKLYSVELTEKDHSGMDKSLDGLNGSKENGSTLTWVPVGTN